MHTARISSTRGTGRWSEVLTRRPPAERLLRQPAPRPSHGCWFAFLSYQHSNIWHPHAFCVDAIEFTFSRAACQELHVRTFPAHHPSALSFPRRLRIALFLGNSNRAKGKWLNAPEDGCSASHMPWGTKHGYEQLLDMDLWAHFLNNSY